MHVGIESSWLKPQAPAGAVPALGFTAGSAEPAAPAAPPGTDPAALGIELWILLGLLWVMSLLAVYLLVRRPPPSRSGPGPVASGRPAAGSDELQALQAEIERLGDELANLEVARKRDRREHEAALKRLKPQTGNAAPGAGAPEPGATAAEPAGPEVSATAETAPDDREPAADISATADTMPDPDAVEPPKPPPAHVPSGPPVGRPRGRRLAAQQLPVPGASAPAPVSSYKVSDVKEERVDLQRKRRRP
ncbi:MAG: hypothetical protein OEZ06_28825 [Myxococcales bacterium]|nr:hypothetical protein [Myxococcales bacterium]